MAKEIEEGKYFGSKKSDVPKELLEYLRTVKFDTSSDGRPRMIIDGSKTHDKKIAAKKLWVRGHVLRPVGGCAVQSRARADQRNPHASQEKFKHAAAGGAGAAGNVSRAGWVRGMY